MKSFFKKVITDEIHGAGISLLKGVLLLLSYIFHWIVSLRSVLFALKIFKQHKLPVPVISVGNLTLGGVGKTPLVSFIVKYLISKEKKPVVLTRGYMDKSSSKKGEALSESDEAVMLKQQSGVDVVVGANRVKSAYQYLKSQSCDVFVLDDGFQHRRCARDLNIVVVDAINPWGNQALLPRGILREPLCALKRADVVVLSKTDGHSDLNELISQIKKMNPHCCVVSSKYVLSSVVDLRTGVPMALEYFKGKRLCSFCSIAAPQSFMQSLRALRTNHIKNFEFMDHYVYQHQDMQNLNDYCLENNIDVLMTTQKDAVKLKGFLDVFSGKVMLAVLNIELQFTNKGDDFIERINSIL